MRLRLPARFPVAARLTSILSIVALLSLALAALVQDRALSAGMQRAAAERLDGSARAVERLLAGRLSERVAHYVSVSRTPALRAHLEIGHRATLERMANSLVGELGASRLAILDTSGALRAHAGPEDSAEALRAAWQRLRSAPADVPRCVEADAAGTAAAFVSCAAGDEARSTLEDLDGLPEVLVWVPLHTGPRPVGTILFAEVFQEQLLADWSELVGATLTIGGGDRDPNDGLTRSIDGFGEVALRVHSSLAPERATLSAARRWEALAAVVALAIALLLSAFVARDFLKPIHEIREVTARLGRGDLDARVRTRRRDEIGDVARVLDDTLERLRASQQRLRNVQEIARFGDWSIDLARDRVEGSLEFERMLGLDAADGHTLGATLRCFAAADRERLDEAIRRCAEDGRSVELDLRRQERASHERILQVHARRISGEGKSAKLEGSVQDVTERRRAEEEIRFLAFHDSLTGLPNRRFLNERLALATASAQGCGFSVFFFDLDRFKMINDTLGHSAGDELLRCVARRLIELFPQQSDASLARFGGDEFTLLLPATVEVSELRAVAEQLIGVISQPFDLQGHEVVVTGSVGIARWPEDGEDIEVLLRSCDTALHRAKVDGRNGYCLYDTSMEEEATRRWKLENRLRRAIDSLDLEVHYQPRVSAADGSLVGFEALLRWHDSGYAPEEFVPIAEETGMIVPLGTWVLRSVAQQLHEWREQGRPVSWVSVNVSGRQLAPDLVEAVRDAISSFEIDPANLEIEVTESALLEDVEVGVAVLNDLRALGVRVFLDDFGTGYSSLSYLRNLPISGVKIDRSFVRSIATDAQDSALAASIVSMAKVLGLLVVAEGVETPEQAELLAEMGCDELQGFLYGAAAHPDDAWQLAKPKRRKKARKRRSRA